MGEYDVVIVGAGPAGTSAGKAASENGARAIILEEHQAVGSPRHCTGRIQGSSFNKDIIRSIDKRVILAECKNRRFFSPSGKMILESRIPAGSTYMVLRDEFDRELARRAVESGADVVLNTRVTNLLRENGKIRGVATNSQSMPAVYGKIVIVAQGARARRTGIPMQESLSYPDEKFAGRILIELAGVHDIEPGVMETHLGAMEERGFIFLWPTGSKSALIALPSLDTFYRIKQGDYVVSRKIRDAVPIQMHGCVWGSRAAVPLPKLVKDGLILIGDSAGYNGIMHAIISGRCAGEIAAAAIEEGNVSERRLKSYEDRCRKIGLHLTVLGWKSLLKLHQLSDGAIETILPEMVEKNEVQIQDVLPF